MNVSINKSVDSTCRGDNITFTASGGTSYLWSNGATTSSITVPADNNPCWVICDSGACRYRKCEVILLSAVGNRIKMGMILYVSGTLQP